MGGQRVNRKDLNMTQSPTSDQVIDAAVGLGQSEFTRADIAAKLGVHKKDLGAGFRGAREAGRFKKLRDDADDNGVFALKS
jgi:hypothetical protein